MHVRAIFAGRALEFSDAIVRLRRERQIGEAACRMHAQDKLRAHRNRDAVAIDRMLKIDRGFARVRRRIDPGIERGGGCARARIRRESEREPFARIRSRPHESADDKQQCYEAQRVAITLLKARPRQAHFEMGDAREELTQMCAPQVLRKRIAGAGGERIVRFRDRAMGERAVLLDAARAVFPARNLKIHQVAVKKRTRREDDKEQERQMERLRHILEQTKEGGGGEQTDDAARRP